MLVKSASGTGVALRGNHIREVAKGACDGQRVVELTTQGKTLLEERTCVSKVTELTGENRESVERNGDTSSVIQLPADFDALANDGLCGGLVTLCASEDAGGKKRAKPGV